jgi:hypothetical protein
MARHDSSGQLNFAVIRQKLADATENAVMHASSGPDRRVHSNTDRRFPFTVGSRCVTAAKWSGQWPGKLEGVPGLRA